MNLLPELIDAYRFARQPKFRLPLLRAGVVFGGNYHWGIAPVSVDPFTYQPEVEGPLALIAGAFEGETLVDLVATSLPTFGVRTRRGDADLLGHDALEDARWNRTPLTLHPDAWSWLRHDRKGCVILNWRAAPGLLSDVTGIRCLTPALARRVKRAFERPLPMPPLLVYSPPVKPKET